MTGLLLAAGIPTVALVGGTVAVAIGAGVVALGATACLPQVGDPEVFQDEIEELRKEWGDVCEDRCGGSDEPFACTLPLDAGTCTRFDQTAAINCFATFRRVTRLEVCGADSERMANLEANCTAVYTTCEVEVEGTGTGTDTGGMDGV